MAESDNLTDTSTATPPTDSTTQDGDNAATEQRPEQKVTVEEIAAGEKKLTIEIPQSRIKDQIEQAYVGLEQDAQLPGFRKGKAPRSLLKKRFASTVLEETTGRLLSDSCSQAIEDENLDLLGEPEIKNLKEIKLPESGDLTYEVSVEVAPDIALPDFSTLQINKPSAEVSDEQVQEEIEKYCERFGEMAEVEDEPIQEGDYVNSDVQIYAGDNIEADSEPIASHPGSYILVHGEDHDHKGHVAGILVQDLGKQLGGQKIEDQIDISLTAHEGHENPDIAGKPITIRIKITAIQRAQPATIEQLVERLGIEDEDKLKSRIREMLEGQAYHQQQDDMHQQALDLLVEQTDVILPEALAKRQLDHTLTHRREHLATEGKSQEEIDEVINKEKPESEKEVQDQLKRFFILSKAAKNLEIEISNDEISYEVTSQAMEMGTRPANLLKQLRKSGRINDMTARLRDRKTMNEIVGKAQVTETDAKPQADTDD